MAGGGKTRGTGQVGGKPFEKHVAALQCGLGAIEKEHPHWRTEVLVSLIKWSLKSLKHYIEQSRESQITWDNPLVELHYPVEWDWTASTDADVFRCGIIYGKVSTKNTAGRKRTLQTLTEIMVQQLNVQALDGCTNGVWYEKKNDYYRPILPLPLAEALQAIKGKKARREAFEQMVRPFAIGGAYVDYGDMEFEDGEPISEKAAAQLAKLDQQMDIPRIGFSGEVNGRKIEMSLVFLINPLLADHDAQKAYFPITIGLAFENGPAKWPRKDRMELWEGLFGAVDQLTDKLIPKAQTEDSVILTVNSQIKVPAAAWRPENRSATIKSMADALPPGWELEQIQVGPTQKREAGACPTCGWIHDATLTAIRIGDGEAVTLGGILPDIVRLVHEAHAKGLPALSTKDDELLKTCGGYGNPCKAFDDLKHRHEYKLLFDTRRRGFIALRGAVGRSRNKSEEIGT